MEDFDQFLKEDPESAAEKVREGLSGLRLENKVALVAEARRAWLRRIFWRRVTFIASLLVVMSVAVLYFFRKETPTPLPPQDNNAPPELQGKQNFTPETPQKELPAERKNVPIADNRQTGKIPPPRFPAPNIRGENVDDKGWKALLDKVWYTDYPPAGMTISATFAKTDQFLLSRDFNNAYVQLQRLERNLPANDTLRFLKGYCLMEMGEGAEALTYFEKLEVKQPNWEMRLQWYRGLSLLLTGDKDKALTVFHKISITTGHSYREQSKQAIQMLE